MMLSVRLPETLENQLESYCEALHISKSAAVQQALEQHLKAALPKLAKGRKQDPLLAMVGSGNRKHSTDKLMRMTRGEGWNKP